MRTRWMALWAVAAVAVLAGCQSASQRNLAEYETLVASRRRNPAPSATPMAVRAAQEKAEAEARAAEARAKEAEARAKRAEAEAAAAKEKAAAAERAAARRAEEKALAERKAEAERNAAEAERKAREAAERETAERAAKEVQRKAAEEKKAEEERKAREAAEREAGETESAVEVIAPPQVSTPAVSSGRPETPAGGNTAYVLAVGDAVQIILRGIPGGEAIEDIIDESGYVTLPLIGEVMAAGCTATQLEKAIRDTYRERRIYKDVNVQVLVPTRFYYMQGEIRGPGRVQLISAVRLSQAIAANGGGTEFWNGKVVVKRNDGRIVNVKNARRLERTPEDDILLEPGDIVELKRSWF